MITAASHPHRMVQFCREAAPCCRVLDLVIRSSAWVAFTSLASLFGRAGTKRMQVNEVNSVAVYIPAIGISTLAITVCLFILHLKNRIPQGNLAFASSIFAINLSHWVSTAVGYAKGENILPSG